MRLWGILKLIVDRLKSFVAELLWKMEKYKEKQENWKNWKVRKNQEIVKKWKWGKIGKIGKKWENRKKIGK